MKLFLDTSVLLAACASSGGASRAILVLAPANGWELITTPYVLDEVHRNLADFPPPACATWPSLRPSLEVRKDVLAFDRPVVFGPPKDRPILFGASCWADVLLTLDEDDFGPLMDQPFYDLIVLTPGTFLKRQRAAGRLS